MEQRTFEDLTTPKFDGKTYDHQKDYTRLKGQFKRVFDAMKDGIWRTLAEIEAITGDPQASISARLRDFRKIKFGYHRVNRQRRTGGTWEYQIEINESWL